MSEITARRLSAFLDVVAEVTYFVLVVPLTWVARKLWNLDD